jgi:hypothetical protein
VDVVDEVVGAILDEGVVEELLGSSGSVELEAVGDGAAVVGAGEEVVGAAAEVAVYQHSLSKDNNDLLGAAALEEGA